jgi:hypothetical protein
MEATNGKSIYLDGSPAFLSEPLAIDFVAYHELQAQVAEPLFASLSPHFQCRWRIGPAQEPAGAKAAVLMDHVFFQPHIRRSRRGYRYLFYLPHDLGDIEVYAEERQRLRDFDMVFVPGPLHLRHARKALGPNQIILDIGWPKYDRMEIPAQYSRLAGQIRSLPGACTVLYAPTWAHTWEWRELFPLLGNLPCNVLIKNHIYVNPGQPFPPGEEAVYADCLQSAALMEEAARSGRYPTFLVAPRQMNICALFPMVNVLISDQSSVNMEFIPFGVSIETGRFNENPKDLDPRSSRISVGAVLFMPFEKLKTILSGRESFETFLGGQSKRALTQESGIRINPIAAGLLGALLIDRYLHLAGTCRWFPFSRSRGLFDEMTRHHRSILGNYGSDDNY